MSTEYNVDLVVGFPVTDSLLGKLRTQQIKKVDNEDLLEDFCRRISGPEASCKPKISGIDGNVGWFIKMTGQKPDSENYGAVQHLPIDKIVSLHREAHIIAKKAQKVGGVDLGEPVIASIMMSF